MVLRVDDDAIRITMRQASDQIEFAPGFTDEQLEQAKAALPVRLRYIAGAIERGEWEYDGQFHTLPWVEASS